MLASEDLSLLDAFSGVSTWLYLDLACCTLTQEWFGDVAAGSSRVFDGGAVAASAKYEARVWFSEVVAGPHRVFGGSTLTASARHET